LIPTVICERDETVEPLAPSMDRFMAENMKKQMRVQPEPIPLNVQPVEEKEDLT
jgi:hypothetical protein